MKKTYLPFLWLLLLTACEKEIHDPAVFDTDQTIQPRSQKDDLTVCHYSDDEQTWRLINISKNAWAAHEAHGDVRLDDQDNDGFVPDNACGFGDMGDCDDNNAAVNPSVTEICDNGLDDDCDGDVDEADSDCPNIPDDGLLRVTLPDEKILMVHPTDNNSNITWGRHGTNILGLSDITSYAEVNNDFNGKDNTRAIVQHLLKDYNYGHYAAKLCDDLIAFGFDDWYLPAIGELNAMYDQLGPNGGSGDIPRGPYWSSTEANANRAWWVYFSDGSKVYYDKNTSVRCRCVRK